MRGDDGLLALASVLVFVYHESTYFCTAYACSAERLIWAMMTTFELSPRQFLSTHVSLLDR